MATPPTSANGYQVFPQFSGEDEGCTNAVFVLPPNCNYGKPSTFQMLNLYTGTGSILPPWSNADFEITLIPPTQGLPTQSNVSVNITLKGNNMWNCAASSRATLMQNFTSFLLWIETNLELTGNLLPGSTVIIAQQIAMSLPAPPLETLFYQYGLVTGLGSGTTPYVNVMAGMQLRIDSQVSQFVTPGSGFNGYVGAGTFSYSIASTPSASGATRLVAFDPFLGAIATPKINNPSPIVAGGIIDLTPVGGAQSYWRLFYPATMAPAGNAGQSSIANNVALVGAATLNALNTATVNYPNPCTSSTTCAYFLGRAIIVPSIQIFISVKNLFTTDWVPIGTTFRNIVERYTILPPTGTDCTLGRGPQNVIFNKTGPVVDLRVYDIPLIAGDVVTVSITLPTLSGST